jgi:hypothetical protein
MATEEVFSPAEPLPPQAQNWAWWFQTGDGGWDAPEYNNGAPYWPEMKVQWIRNITWFFRNPLGNFVGYGLGLAGIDRTIKGTAPVMATTGRDERPPRLGWKWAVTNGKYPYVSYWGGRIEMYLGWRPAGGGFGAKFTIRKDAYSDQPTYPNT